MTFLPIVERELRVAARSGATYWVRFTIPLAGMLFCLPQLLWTGAHGDFRHPGPGPPQWASERRFPAQLRRLPVDGGRHQFGTARGNPGFVAADPRQYFRRAVGQVGLSRVDQPVRARGVSADAYDSGLGRGR